MEFESYRFGDREGELESAVYIEKVFERNIKIRKWRKG